MKLEQFYYNDKKGWSVDQFPALDSEQTLLLVFCDPKFIEQPAVIEKLVSAYPRSKILGCSTAGEIVGPAIMDNCISVAVLKFDKTILRVINIPISSRADSYNSGEKIVNALKADDLKGIFVLSEGININGSELVRGLNTLNNSNIVITGGLAGDGANFKKTWMIIDGKLQEDYISAVGFYGDNVNIGFGSCGGWDIFGPEREITRSRENVLYELDGRPALDLYKEYLGDKASGLPATGLLFPLAIRKDKDDPNTLVRTILGIDEKEKSLTFAGDMPMGYIARLMYANFDRIIAGANTAAKQTLLTHKRQNKLNGSPLLLIAISCVGRRLLLGERTDEETESVYQMFPKGLIQVGFYSYGELSPYSAGKCDLHNQTMTITTISEEG